jgi:hypothetical protein
LAQSDQIDKLVSDINKTEPIIAPNWKEETTNVSINVTNNAKPNLMLTEDDFSKVLVSPIQIRNNQVIRQIVSYYVKLQVGRKKPLPVEVRIFYGNCNYRLAKEPIL